MGRKSMKSLLLGKYQESQNCVTWSPVKFFYFLCLFDSSQMLNLPLLRSVLWPTEWDISTYKFMDLWISSRSIYQSNSQTGRGLDWNFSELKCGPNPFFAVLLSHFFHIFNVSWFFWKSTENCFDSQNFKWRMCFLLIPMEVPIKSPTDES